jgi:hypothetical protein
MPYLRGTLLRKKKWPSASKDRYRRSWSTRVDEVSGTDKLDAQDRLILVQVKVRRAEKHLRDLAEEILALEHTTILTPDPNTGVALHPIALLHPNNFQKVPTLSFDTLTIAGDESHLCRGRSQGGEGYSSRN